MKRINFFNGLIMLVGLALLYSCNQRQSTKPQQFNPEFGNYIYAYTTGVISSHAAIVIKLQHDVNLPDVNSGDMLEMDLFKFDPKISGETYLDDIRTIRFVPDEPLQSKQQYEVSFALGKVMEVEKDLASFDFQFSIIAQSFSVSKTGFGLYDNKDLAHYFINGFVTTADVMDEPDVMKLLRARQGKLELPIRWVMKGYTKKFDFIVDSVLRTDPIEPVVISWDGDLLNLDITGTDTTRIPAPGDFKVVEVNVIQQPEQYIQLQFSDPLMESQNLDGIVHVDGEPASYLRVAAIATGGAGMVPMTPSALTAPDGKFELATYEAGDGVPPGEYQLTFVWGEISLLNGQYTGDKMKGKYAKSAASQYKINVNPGDVPIDLGTIELKTK